MGNDNKRKNRSGTLLSLATRLFAEAVNEAEKTDRKWLEAMPKVPGEEDFHYDGDLALIHTDDPLIEIARLQAEAGFLDDALQTVGKVRHPHFKHILSQAEAMAAVACEMEKAGKTPDAKKLFDQAGSAVMKNECCNECHEKAQVTVATEMARAGFFENALAIAEKIESQYFSNKDFRKSKVFARIASEMVLSGKDDREAIPILEKAIGLSKNSCRDYNRLASECIAYEMTRIGKSELVESHLGASWLSSEAMKRAYERYSPHLLPDEEFEGELAKLVLKFKTSCRIGNEDELTWEYFALHSFGNRFNIREQWVSRRLKEASTMVLGGDYPQGIEQFKHLSEMLGRSNSFSLRTRLSKASVACEIVNTVNLLQKAKDGEFQKPNFKKPTHARSAGNRAKLRSG